MVAHCAETHRKMRRLFLRVNLTFLPAFSPRGKYGFDLDYKSTKKLKFTFFFFSKFFVRTHFYTFILSTLYILIPPCGERRKRFNGSRVIARLASLFALARLLFQRSLSKRTDNRHLAHQLKMRSEIPRRFRGWLLGWLHCLSWLAGSWQTCNPYRHRLAIHLKHL